MSRILLVDNDPVVIEALRACLEAEGHHLMTALDGWEAFELVAGKMPDAVITDWQMPRIDGLDLCRMLRRQRSSVGLPVIVMSADAPPTGRHALLYDAFLRKPVIVEALLDLVSRLTSRRLS